MTSVIRPGRSCQRILIESGAFRTSLTDLSLAQLPALEYTVEGSGHGTITFGPTGALLWGTAGWSSQNAPRVPAFRAVEQAADVYALIESARAERQGVSAKK